MSSNNLIVFVEGNIAIGKGQFIAGLSRILSKNTVNISIHTHLRTSGETLFGNGMNLNDVFHLDPGRWASEFLVWNLSEKLRFIKECCKETHNSIIIIERSIATESLVFIQSLYECEMISVITYETCVNLIRQLSELFEMLQTMTTTLTYIYMRTDPSDLYECLLSHNVYDCLNFQLLKTIHKNYEKFIATVEDDPSGTKYVVSVDVTYEHIIKPSATIMKNAFKKLQKIYPALNHMDEVIH